jgi:alkylation response protein AidB-like acyl-CoA dehydrogenase
MNNGLSEESVSAITQAVRDWQFNAVNHSTEDGGQGFDVFEQMLLNEQLGRATNALWTVPHQPASAMRFSTPEQKQEYLIPTCQVRRRDAYVITEPGAGSDVRSVLGLRRFGGHH